MAITVKNLSELFGKDVFTNKGIFAGKVIDVDINLSKFRLQSLVIEATRGGFLSSIVGGKKGVIVPYSLVDNVGDIVIIKHISAASIPEEKQEEETPVSGLETF
ncbi:MAG: PRC-barrel domain-containing protein [Candidatus Aenigmarchaeota archaeon]|nr:PRC-barrel domain-containing protein [Candidatus Aenigmarchaeota archaeon]